MLFDQWEVLCENKAKKSATKKKGKYNTAKIREKITKKTKVNSTATRVQSFPNVLKIIKKNLHQLQEKDCFLTIRNNVQSTKIRNPAITAGKYIIYTKGNTRKECFTRGIKRKRKLQFIGGQHLRRGDREETQQYCLKTLETLTLRAKEKIFYIS